MVARGRYAPSPTGRMHLGNARTALAAWMQIRALGGTFVLRIEDLDPGRARDRFTQGLLDDLHWLGLDWDEGPEVGGPYAPYVQSQRGVAYAEALARLDVYPCRCSRREIREASFAPHGAEPIYPGICRDRAVDPSGAVAWRWRVPPGTVTLDDDLEGRRDQNVARDVGDFVLRRSDGAWAYQLAVVVDDAMMQITHVLRGVDLLDSTPRQIHLQRALGLETPRYAHVPLVLGADGEKLSKRHGAPDLATLRAAGVEPSRVVAALGESLGLVHGIRGVTPYELARDFALDRIRPPPGMAWLDRLRP